MDNLNVAVADEKKNVLELIGKLFKDNDSFELIGTAKNSEAVSYTHLDVYKRQCSLRLSQLS